MKEADIFSKPLKEERYSRRGALFENLHSILTLFQLRPMGVKLIGVETDADGLNTDCLRQVLSSKWRPEDAKSSSCS